MVIDIEGDDPNDNILPFTGKTRLRQSRKDRQLFAYQEALAKAQLEILNLKIKLSHAENYKNILMVAGVKNYDHIT